MDLERELRALEIAWPETPAFALELRRRRRRWPLAAAAALAAVAAAFAVPQSRAAILRFLDLGGERIQIVKTLPPAQERGLGAGLGPEITLAEAKQRVPALLLPPGATPPLHQLEGVVSFVFDYRGTTVLLSELPNTSPIFLKKLVGGGTRVETVNVRGVFGLWLSGAPHVFFFPREPARLAGNVLVWVSGATYRIEGKVLTKADAFALAESLR